MRSFAHNKPLMDAELERQNQTIRIKLDDLRTAAGALQAELQ